jgi:hypothetical protein
VSHPGARKCEKLGTGFWACYKEEGHEGPCETRCPGLRACGEKELRCVKLSEHQGEHDFRPVDRRLEESQRMIKDTLVDTREEWRKRAKGSFATLKRTWTSLEEIKEGLEEARASAAFLGETNINVKLARLVGKCEEALAPKRKLKEDLLRMFEPILEMLEEGEGEEDEQPNVGEES